VQAQELIKYINNPALLTKESIPLLQKLVNDFPYFQSGHILLSMAAKKWDSSVYQQSIRKTAIVVTNRSHLYNLIHKSEIINEEVIVETSEIATQPITITENKKEKIPVISEVEKPAEKIEKPITHVDENAVEIEVEKALIASIVEKEITGASEFLNQEKKEQPANFADWLQFLKKNNGESYNEIEEKVNRQKSEKQKEQLSKTKQKQKELIDKIIDTNPGLIRQKEEQKFFKSDFKAKESLLENEHLVTETLAQIYAMQGNINKAIRAYEILSLKFPHKSVYFKGLIQKLKNNQ
jgi:hypothetical protein